jgi:hypothetical protein
MAAFSSGATGKFMVVLIDGSITGWGAVVVQALSI